MERDDWGRDPGVQVMRKAFSAMETQQRLLLARGGIDPLDARLGAWRRKALTLFEKAWATGAPGTTGTDDLPELYIRCLIQVLSGEGILFPRESGGLEAPPLRFGREEP
jgi:hypothetical protein